jgi:hypothetical protein
VHCLFDLEPVEPLFTRILSILKAGNLYFQDVKPALEACEVITRSRVRHMRELIDVPRNMKRTRQATSDARIDKLYSADASAFLSI